MEYTDSFWEIRPLLGLGPLQFLMTRSQVEDYSSVIGSVQAVRSYSAESQQEGLQEIYAMFPDFFSEEDLRITSAVLSEFGTELDDQIVEYRKSGLSFEFTTGQLTEVFADCTAKNLWFKHLPVFSGSPVRLILTISNVLNEQPIILGQELIFPEHKIYLFSFVEEVQNGSGLYRIGDQHNRSISWRNTVRPNSVELSQYHAVNMDKLALIS